MASQPKAVGEGPAVRGGPGSGKRILDLMVLLLTSWIWVPLQLLTALSVWVVMGRPLIFAQRRCGFGGRQFTLYKFRTMTDARDEKGDLLPDEFRLTPFAAFLRATSLDELPSLLNVVLGDMSLVGPRPLLPEYLPLYTPEQSRRHEVRPGLTGWAQVNGRNAISWDEKFKLDVWYVDHRSLGFDLRILRLTVLAVLRARGISQAGHVTMQPFRGSRR
jgi:sugar transferase EpsL